MVSLLAAPFSHGRLAGEAAKNVGERGSGASGKVVHAIWRVLPGSQSDYM